MTDLYINVDKCKIMTYYRSQRFIKYDYQLDNNLLLLSVTIVEDFGIVMVPSFDFQYTIIAKIMRVLEFFRRNVTKFNPSRCL